MKGKRHTILFIHGFPMDSAMWRGQLFALSRWTRILPDLWGAGTATILPTAPEYSIADHAADLIRGLDDDDDGEVVVCGLSMGGYIVFELLRSFPGRIRAAILCNTKAAADSAEAKLARDDMAARVEREGMEALAAELVPKMLARTTLEHRPAVVRKLTAMIKRQPMHGVVRALRALRERPDSTPLLGTIRVPVLVIAGDDDQITPAAGMREMARAIPGAEFMLIADAGHVSPLEQPKAVNAVIDGFVARL